MSGQNKLRECGLSNQLTVSVGILSGLSSSHHKRDVLAAAFDETVFQAKKAGRNCLVESSVAPDSP